MEAYHAIIEPFGVNSVSGTAVVITTSPTATTPGNIFYGGSITGLEANLSSSIDCTAKNGCGVHIHSGKGCQDLLAQEGHYYEHENIDGLDYADPWAEIRYSSDGEGRAVFGGFVDIGSKQAAADLVGRAFLVHAQDGSRIGCGLLQETTTNRLHASLNGSKQDGQVYTVDAGNDAICFVGSANGLSSDPVCQPNILSNSCGVHVHAGNACDSKDAQGGHWFQQSDDEDPWKLVGYPTTDASGHATFGDCVTTGFPASEALSKPFIVHEQDGGRAICGILESYTGGESESYFGESLSSNGESLSSNGESLSSIYKTLFTTIIAILVSVGIGLAL